MDIETNRSKFLFYNSMICLLKALEGKKITVELRDGRKLIGFLISVEKDMNLNMSDVEYADVDEYEELCNSYENFYVKGRQIRFVMIPDDVNIIDAMKSQLNTREVHRQQQKKEMQKYFDRKQERGKLKQRGQRQDGFQGRGVHTGRGRGQDGQQGRGGQTLRGYRQNWQQGRGQYVQHNRGGSQDGQQNWGIEQSVQQSWGIGQDGQQSLGGQWSRGQYEQRGIPQYEQHGRGGQTRSRGQDGLQYRGRGQDGQQDRGGHWGRRQNELRGMPQDGQPGRRGQIRGRGHDGQQGRGGQIRSGRGQDGQ